MQKSKIPWCDMTWNPITGCLNNCTYCYARKIANRFAPKLDDGTIGKSGGLNDIKNTNIPFPHGFEPTLYRNRLDEPQKAKRPQNIFVCSMADLFGDWIPDEWIKEVFAACDKAPWHNYLFLTKNPKRYRLLADNKLLSDADNLWYGTTVTNKDAPFFWSVHHRTFISHEPLLSMPPFAKGVVDWIIIGQQTNPTIEPKGEWVQWIINQCREHNVPVFIKPPLYEKFPIQEYPKGLI